jgi:hypothetical protein
VNRGKKEGRGPDVGPQPFPLPLVTELPRSGALRRSRCVRTLPSEEALLACTYTGGRRTKLPERTILVSGTATRTGGRIPAVELEG